MSTELDKQAAQTTVLIGKFLGECFKLRGLPRVVKDLELIMPTMQLLIEEQFQAFASQVREQSKWVSVAELPKERHEVLICHSYYAERAVEPAFYSEGWWQLVRTDSEDMPIVIGPEQVTHWMGIPAPPQTTEQEER